MTRMNGDNHAHIPKATTTSSRSSADPRRQCLLDPPRTGGERCCVAGSINVPLAERFVVCSPDLGGRSDAKGFRDYSRGLNRCVTRDAYNGVLPILTLVSTRGPATGTCSACNPISAIENDGQVPF